MKSDNIEREKRTSKINSWKPKDSSEIYVDKDGKLFVCYFEKVFPENAEKVMPYDRFVISKASYEAQLEIITRYINFFINVYDKDMELMTAYLKLKFALDKQKLYDKDAVNGFIDLIYEIMFTPTMVEKIRQMVEENYLDDIESDDENKKKYVKSEKKHLESLEFTNQHVKVLLDISFGIKILSPVMFHYTRMNGVDTGKNTYTIYKFYERLFSIFGYGTDYNIYNMDGSVYKCDISHDQVMEHVDTYNLERVNDGYTHRYYFDLSVLYPDEESRKVYYAPVSINMYNKLWIYVKAKVLESNASNSPIFAQREVFGVDLFTVVNMFTKRVLISDNMVKQH
jgi:hypothetical protein